MTIEAEARIDVAIVGAGAAGLATAIFAVRANPRLRVLLLEGARRPGAKILVSGGSRCNVTNTIVTEADFNGGRPAVIRRILRAFPVSETIAFFRELGVPLHEEPGGKLFPDSNQSRDVLDALLREVARLNVTLRAGARVTDIRRNDGDFQVVTAHGEIRARSVVFATGGLSLPKTGSDGWGYDVVRRLGHTIVPTTPALAPLVLGLDAGASTGLDASIHSALTGVAQPARIDIRVDGAIAQRVSGAMLWTHFGISGPAALDASRHWLRAKVEGRATSVSVSLLPQEQFDSLDASLTALARTNPRLIVSTAVADRIPASVAAAIVGAIEIPAEQTLAELTRESRRRLVRALLEWPLPVRDSRGYNYAEVTAGGVALEEIDPGTMGSRVCKNVHLVGEILDVDGRLGGFNFQWAWCTGRVAGLALGR